MLTSLILCHLLLERAAEAAVVRKMNRIEIFMVEWHDIHHIIMSWSKKPAAKYVAVRGGFVGGIAS